MQKHYVILLIMGIIFLSCKSKQIPENKTGSEGGQIPEVSISANEQVYAAISASGNAGLKTLIVQDTNKATNVAKFKNKVFISSVGGKWMGIGVADNYDIYYTRTSSSDISNVVNTARDPNYYDARKILIPPIYDASLQINAGINLGKVYFLKDQDKKSNMKVRLGWLGRVNTKNFNIQPGDDFELKISLNNVYYVVGELIHTNKVNYPITQTLLDSVKKETGQPASYFKEENPSSEHTIKWSFSSTYSHSSMPKTEFRFRSDYTYKNEYVPGLDVNSETKAVFDRTYSLNGQSLTARFYDNMVSKNIWIGEVTLSGIYNGNKPASMQQTVWNANKDKKFEVFIAQFDDATYDEGTGSYIAAQYDGYNASDMLSGNIVFINPEVIN